MGIFECLPRNQLSEQLETAIRRIRIKSRFAPIDTIQAAIQAAMVGAPTHRHSAGYIHCVVQAFSFDQGFLSYKSSRLDMSVRLSFVVPCDCFASLLSVVAKPFLLVNVGRRCRDDRYLRINCLTRDAYSLDDRERFVKFRSSFYEKGPEDVVRSFGGMCMLFQELTVDILRQLAMVK